MNSLYLDDYSNEELLDFYTDINIKSKAKSKPTIIIKPNINIKGDKTAVLSVSIPINNDKFTIDIIINNEMYKNIGNYL
jgi:hypothetical protein